MCLLEVSIAVGERDRDAPVERSLIRTVIEHLQELRATEMEHELRIYTEVIG
jgi:hypothetical protein